MFTMEDIVRYRMPDGLDSHQWVLNLIPQRGEKMRADSSAEGERADPVSSLAAGPAIDSSRNAPFNL